MSTLTSYKQLQVVTPDPSGAGGLALNDNFMGLADCIGPCNYTATADPTTSDNQSTGYYTGSRWFNTSTNDEFVCISSTMSTAVWEKTTGGNSTPTLQDVTDAGNTTTDDISLANVFLATGDTLSVDNLSDAGSGSITIGTATVLSGNSWSIDSSGDGGFNSLFAYLISGVTLTIDSIISTPYLNVDFLGYNNESAISVTSDISFGNGSLIDTVGNATFTSLASVYGDFAIDSVGNGTFSTVTNPGNSFTIDASGNGTFANVMLGVGDTLSVDNVTGISSETVSIGSLAVGVLIANGNAYFNYGVNIDSGALDYDYSDSYFASALSSYLTANYYTQENTSVQFSSLSLSDGTVGNVSYIAGYGYVAGYINNSGNQPIVEAGTVNIGNGDDVTELAASATQIDGALVFNSGATAVMPTIDSTVTTGAVMGQFGFDTNTLKSYTFDGTVWQAHW